MSSVGDASQSTSVGPFANFGVGGGEGQGQKSSIENLIGPDVLIAMATMLGFPPETIQMMKDSVPELFGSSSVASGATPINPDQTVEQMGNLAVEGDVRTSIANQSRFGVDTMLDAFNTLTDYSLVLFQAVETIAPSIKDAIKQIDSPSPQAADLSIVDKKMSSADVYGLIAEVLSKLAERGYEDKVVESQINSQAQGLKQENQSLSNIMMQKQMEVANAQRAKAERLETHGLVTKIVASVLAVVLFVVMVVVLIIMAIITVFLVCTGIGAIGAALMWTIAMQAIAVTIIALVTAVGIGAAAASLALTLAMTWSTMSQEGGLIDKMLEALGLEANEWTRILAQMLMQFVIAAAGGIASLVTAAMMFPVMAVENVIKAVIMLIIQVIMVLLQLIIAVVVSSGLLEKVVREIALASGADEETARKISMLTQIAVMLAAIAATIALAAAMGAVAMKEVGEGLGELANLPESFGKFAQGMAAAASSQMVKGALATAEIVQMMGEVFQAIGEIVMGSVAISSGAIQMQIAELEKEAAELEYKQDLLKTMNETLKALIDSGMQIMEAITDDMVRDMEIGNAIWGALSKAGSMHDRL